MRRFLKGLVSGLTPIVMIGALAVAALGDLGSGAVTAADVLAQVDDDADDAVGDSAAPRESLTPIEAYLVNIFPDGEGEALPSAQRVVLSRDPFNPVVPSDADGTTDGGTTDGDGTNGGTTDGTDGDGTDGDGTDGDGTDGTDGDGTDDDTEDKCLGDEEEQVCADDERGTFVVTLEGFTDEGLIRVTVDGTTYTVGVDEDFALHFRVVAINDPCATLLFGDEAFSICTGVTVLK